MSETPDSEAQRQAEELNAIDPRPEAQHRLTPAEESKLLARIDESVAKKAQIIKTGAIPYRLPTEPVKLPEGFETIGFTEDPAHVDPARDGWFSSPGSDILRRPVYNDKGEFVGSQEMWADQPNKRRKR